MNPFNLLKAPSANQAVYGAIILLSIVFSIILIANPGYYNHNELAKIDFILKNGLGDYLSTYTALSPVPGNPLTPVPMALEGIIAAAFHDFPFVVHLIDVLIHALAACFLFSSVLRFTANRELAWVSALIFIFNPLVSFSAGWASMLSDSLYMLFGLLAYQATDSYLKSINGTSGLTAIFGWAVLSALSSELAIVLPLVFLVLTLFFKQEQKGKQFWISFGVWLAPAILLTAGRLATGIFSQGGGNGNPIESLLVYLVYPFFATLSEAHAWSLEPSAIMVLAGVLHLGLIALLFIVSSPRTAAAYLSIYFLFILPVLFKATPDSHYLYGPGAVFSLGLAALLTSERTRGNIGLSAASFILLAAALVHSVVNQHYFYQTGACMKQISSTLESSYLTDSGPKKMAILVEPEAPGYILSRYIKDRDRVGSHHPVSFEIVNWEQRSEINSNYLFNCDCIVYKPSIADLEVLDWGPRVTTPGTVPNQQPDGSAGIWIKVAGTLGYGDLQVLIDGKPANATVVQPELITAAISAENFSTPGPKEITVKQVYTGRIYKIGTFTVETAQ